MLKKISELNVIKSASSNDDWLPTITPTNFEAISSINQVPKSAKLTLDLRITSPKQLLLVKNILKNNHAKILETFGDGIIFNQKPTPLIQTWGSTVTRITHKPVKLVILTGASDARHLPKATQIIVTRGIGGNAHGDNEWVDIQSLNQLSAITKLFINELTV